MIDPDILPDHHERWRALLATMERAQADDGDGEWHKSAKVTRNDHDKFKAAHEEDVRIKWQIATRTTSEALDDSGGKGGRLGFLLMKKWPE